MTKNNSLAFKVEPVELDAFCKKIIKRSRNAANIHEALVVLEAFVSSFSSDSQGADNYRAIQNILKSHSEITRQSLMDEKILQLEQALRTHQVQMLADIYTSLSRNGFYQILSTAIGNIDKALIAEISLWVIRWANEAKIKAEKASGYPDALDFKKANIAIEHYQSMTDIAYFFNHTYQHDL
ncbi:hypothetical protein [sulfur-oxidizing endosymbiont of Gigantopelta aegis]|uniref:hypothetical protein n=1 Tax=sulfur-oxidizing endosymbiont of Gigantopelta aegis TaxID=2794934 RepID=UPI0018DDE7DE|nr:hypothetical protein [sulfur-oxidizing endosymbiont of Gigantopelta aegis]